MIDSLPRQTFSQLMPFYYETPSSYTPIVKQPPVKKQKRSKKQTTTPQQSQDTSETSLSTHEETLCSTHPLCLNNCSFMTQIPVHPNIRLSCAFCKCELDSVSHFIEQPHARRRFTPACDNCHV